MGGSFESFDSGTKDGKIPPSKVVEEVYDDDAYAAYTKSSSTRNDTTSRGVTSPGNEPVIPAKISAKEIIFDLTIGKRDRSSVTDSAAMRELKGLFKDGAPKDRGAVPRVQQTENDSLIKQSRKVQDMSASTGMSGSSRKQFEELMKVADKLCQNPTAIQERQAALRKSSNALNRLDTAQGLEELKEPRLTAANVRLSYAEALLTEGDEATARKILLESIANDKRIVQSDSFLNAFNAAGGRYDRELAQAFKAAGGTDGMLKSAFEQSMKLAGNETFNLTNASTLAPEKIHNLSAKEQEERLSKWSEVLCGAQGPAAAEALYSRLSSVLKDPELGRQLLSRLGKEFETAMAKDGKVPGIPACNAIAEMAKQGDTDATRLLVRIAGTTSDKPLADVAQMPPDDYVSPHLAAPKAKSSKMTLPPELSEPKWNSAVKAADILCDIASKQPSRQVEVLNALLAGLTKHGDYSKTKELERCTQKVLDSLDPAKLTKQAREGDDAALTALAYQSPDNKTASSLLLSLSAESGQQARAIQALARAADMGRCSQRVLPIAAAVVSGLRAIPDGYNKATSMETVTQRAKAGDAACMHLLMSAASDEWLAADKSKNSTAPVVPGSTMKILENAIADPANAKSFNQAFADFTKARHVQEVPREIFDLKMKATAGERPEQMGPFQPASKLLADKARTGDTEALKLLCLAAAGASKEFDTSASNLKALCDTPERTKKVLSTMQDVCRESGDSGALLKTLGSIAATQDQVPPDVRDTITEAFRLSAQHGKDGGSKMPYLNYLLSEGGSSAIEGYLAINPPSSWDAKTIDEIVNNPSLALSFELSKLEGSISPDKGRALAEAVITRLSQLNEKSASASSFDCGLMLDSVAPFLKPEDISKLIPSPAYDTRSGRLNLGQDLLRLYDKGTPELKESIINALTTHGWSELLQDGVRQRVVDHITNNKCSLDRLDRLYASVSNLGIPMPIALQLKRLGVHPEYSEEKLQALAHELTEKHGFDKLNATFSNALAYNLSSPAVQDYLRSDRKPGVSENGSLLSESVQSLPVDLNTLIDQLATGGVGADNQFLEKVPMRLSDLMKVAEKEETRLTQAYSKALKEREALASAVKSTDARQSDKVESQTQQTRELKDANMRCQLLEGRIRSLSAETQSITGALIVHKYNSLLTQGQTAEANSFALKASADPSSGLAQSVRDQFQKGGVWRGLELEGCTALADIGRLRSGAAGVEDGLSMFRDYKPSIGRLNSSGGFSSASTERALLIEKAVLGQARNAVLGHPSLQRLNETATQLGQFMHVADNINHLFNGKASTETAKYLCEKLPELKSVLDRVRPDDIVEAKRLAADLEKLSQDKSVNSTARESAKALSEQLAKVAEVLDPNSTMGQQMRLLCSVKETDLKEPSFWEKTKEIAAYTVVAIATAAAVTATMGATLPVLLAVVPTACLVTREATAEVLHSVNIGEGSIPGAHLRGKVVRDEKTGDFRLQSECELTGRLAQSYAEEIAMNAACLGVAKVGVKIRQATIGSTKVLEKGADQTSQILQTIAAGAEQRGLSTAGTFWRDFKNQIGPGIAMAGVTQGTTSLGLSARGAGLGVAFAQGLLSRGHVPTKIKIHGEPEPVYRNLESQGLLETSASGDRFLKLGDKRIKLEHVEGSEKSANNKQQTAPHLEIVDADPPGSTFNGPGAKHERTRSQLRLPMTEVDKFWADDQIIKQMSRHGLPSRSFDVEFTPGTEGGSYNPNINRMVLPWSTPSPHGSFGHELLHVSRTQMRSELSEMYHKFGEGEVYGRAMLEQCVKGLGDGGTIATANGLERRSTLQPANRELGKELLREWHKGEASWKWILQEDKFKSLVDDPAFKGDRDALYREIEMELEFFDKCKNDSRFSDPEDGPVNSGNKVMDESIQRDVDNRDTKPSNTNRLEWLLEGFPDSVVAKFDKGKYWYGSVEEIHANVAGYAEQIRQRIKVMDERKELAGLSPEARKQAIQLECGDLIRNIKSQVDLLQLLRESKGAFSQELPGTTVKWEGQRSFPKELTIEAKRALGSQYNLCANALKQLGLLNPENLTRILALERSSQEAFIDQLDQNYYTSKNTGERIDRRVLTEDPKHIEIRQQLVLRALNDAEKSTKKIRQARNNSGQ